MHDGMQYEPIQGRGQGHEPLKVGNLPSFFLSFFLSSFYLFPPFLMRLANDHGFIKLGHNTKSFIGTDF